MKRIYSFLLVTAFALTGLQAHDSDTHVSLSLDQGIFTDYVWRGINFNDQAVNQGSVDVGLETEDLGSFGFNIWYNMDLNENREYGLESSTVTEIDYTLYWEKSFDIVTLGAGYIYYAFPEDDTIDTSEVYISASLDTFLAPSLTIYKDVDLHDGVYIDFGIGHDFEITETLALSVGANIGWADSKFSEANYGNNDSGFTNYSIGASIDIPLTDNLTLTPSIMYYGLLSDAKDQRQDDFPSRDDENGVVAGINLSLSF